MHSQSKKLGRAFDPPPNQKRKLRSGLARSLRSLTSPELRLLSFVFKFIARSLRYAHTELKNGKALQLFALQKAVERKC